MSYNIDITISGWIEAKKSYFKHIKNNSTYHANRVVVNQNSTNNTTQIADAIKDEKIIISAHGMGDYGCSYMENIDNLDKLYTTKEDSKYTQNSPYLYIKFHITSIDDIKHLNKLVTDITAIIKPSQEIAIFIICAISDDLFFKEYVKLESKLEILNKISEEIILICLSEQQILDISQQFNLENNAKEQIIKQVLDIIIYIICSLDMEKGIVCTHQGELVVFMRERKSKICQIFLNIDSSINFDKSIDFFQEHRNFANKNYTSFLRIIYPDFLALDAFVDSSVRLYDLFSNHNSHIDNSNIGGHFCVMRGNKLLSKSQFMDFILFY